ncbi:protein deadpan-like isoform X2 [Cylas formicarius]|uniref:protein deadpan-like isoform X2 n=1 Tax=Cylas formicarius TaxID=197179 RepID=UPI002958DA74|nr:protein deadpan-like isoform X2 [Cylas formicarius]
MPISEDELEPLGMQEQHGGSTMSKAELRKTHKPIMEKRRRARINNCLNEIKHLILEAMNKDPARHSKLEKADILEMAVKHLQNIQRQQLAIAVATDPTVLRKFKTGFNDCAREIDKSETTDASLKQRVSSHLQKCMNGLEQVAQFAAPTLGNFPFGSSGGLFSGNQTPNDSASDDQNNNPRIQIPQGIQLIPSRLPTGELALLVPNSSNLPYFPIQRPSAFVTVTPQHTTESLSPPVSPPEARSRSPRGFRPVKSGLPKPKPSYPGEDHQVPQISSTVPSEKHQFVPPMEVKTMKFPIHKYHERKVEQAKKFSEPLCIITNQAERHKQAQQKDDSAHFEENLVPGVRGVKRNFCEVQQQHQGILSTVPQEGSTGFTRPAKILKVNHHVVPSSTLAHPSTSFAPPTGDFQRAEQPKEPREYRASAAKDNQDVNDMWRPW